MHAAEREKLILGLMQDRGFVAFQDLDRLETSGVITRVRGGAKLNGWEEVAAANERPLSGVPFHENIGGRSREKAAIGRLAATLCKPGESVIIDGGSTTLQMCPHLEPLGLNVLTNSLHIVSALLPQARTKISVPAGSLFREQNIVLSAFEDDGMSRYQASKLFIGAAALGKHGLMQSDALLVQAERRLLARTGEVIVLVDSSKFEAPAGHVVCDLGQIDVVVTDQEISPQTRRLLEDHDVKVMIAAP
jgi:DeoR family ulaG and ulaABCDEF operon transcriptional repressor